MRRFAWRPGADDCSSPWPCILTALADTSVVPRRGHRVGSLGQKRTCTCVAAPDAYVATRASRQERTCTCVPPKVEELVISMLGRVWAPAVTVWDMRRLSDDQLRRRTLCRQFPTILGRGPEAVIELLRRLGPIQSQVPRAPFLTISSRLPGVGYDAVCSLFESHQLLKTSNIRGTVLAASRSSLAGWTPSPAALGQLSCATSSNCTTLRRSSWLPRSKHSAQTIGRRAPRSWLMHGRGWRNGRQARPCRSLAFFRQPAVGTQRIGSAPP